MNFVTKNIQPLRLFLWAFCLLPGICAAQTHDELIQIIQNIKSEKKTDEISKIKRSAAIRMAYHNSVFYPGLRMGIELPLALVTVTRHKKKDRIKGIFKDRFVTAHLSWYHHPGFHSNYYLTVGGMLRRTKLSGFFMQSSLEVGYSRTFIAASTYQVLDNGQVGLVKAAGQNYFAGLIGGGVGYDYFIKKSKPFKLCVNLYTLLLSPYNSSVYPRGILEIGLIYTPKKFIKINNTVKTKIK